MRTWIATGVALIVCAFLSGCSDDEPRRGTPASAPTSKLAESPDVEPQSLKKFIRVWQQEAFAMQGSGETAAYRDLSSECETCLNLADTVDRIYADGGSITPGRVKVVDLRRVGGRGDVQIFDFELHSTPSIVIRKAGGSPQTLPGGVEKFQVNVHSTPLGPRVSRLGQIA